MRGEVRELCRKTFRETVRDMEINPELRRALKTHERVPVFIDNLARELSTTQFQVKKEHIVQATRDLTRTFVQMVERQNSERVMSDIGRSMIKATADKKAQLQKDVETFEGLGANETVENKKGQTEIQRIDVDKNFETLKEITER